MASSAMAAPVEARATAGLRLALWVTCAHAVLLPVFNTLNLLRIGQPIWLAYLYGSFVLLPAVFGLALVVQPGDRVKRLDAFELFMLFTCFWGLVHTLRFGGDGIDILGKALRLVMAFTAYKVGRQLLDSDLAQRFLGRFSKAAAWGVGLAILIVYPIGVFGPLRAVISIFSESILATLAFLGLRNGEAKGKLPQGVLLAGAIALLVFSGKRGNYVAAGLMALFAVVLLLRTRQLSIERMRLPIAIGLLGSMLLVLTFSGDAANQLLQGLPYGMRSRLDVFLSDRSGAEITANRSLEVDLALRQIGYEPFGFITGLGLGASLPGVVGRSADTIHIQPLFMTFLLGVVGLLLWIWALVGSIRPFLHPNLAWTRSDLIYSALAFGLMMTTLTSATFLSTPFLWLAIGYLQRRSQELASAELTPA